MKGKIRKCAAFGVILIIGLVIRAEAVATPNYGNSHEVMELYYDGYVQCQPSFNENGKHAARAYFTYKNGAEGTVTKATEWGKGFNDTRILSVSYRYRDTLNPIAPKVTFNYYFTYANHNGVWPVSLGSEEM